jgi:hypothetical protein
MTYLPTILAYLGPETMLPMTSVVAGAAGVLMMFGRSSLRWFTGTVRRFGPPAKPVPEARRIGSAPLVSTRGRVQS